MFSRQIEASLTYQYQNTIVITGNDKSELGCYPYLDVWNSIDWNDQQI